MKKTSLYLAFIAFAIASLFSSCASLQKGEFAQRKYYNFPRSKHDVTEITSVHQKKNTVAQNIITDQKQNIIEPVLSASVDKKKVLLTKKESNSSLKKVKPTAASPVLNNTQAKATDISFKKSDIKNLARENSFPFTRGDAAIMLFVAVVACIFFPPLGIYIKDHRTNKWFWITLLLALIGGGLFLFGPPGGLWAIAWIAAVVIALMTVFDILRA